MPIIKEHKLIFQHIPKTGGQSICNFFGVEGDGHQHANHYRDFADSLGSEWQREWATFTVVREPVERFISAWNMYRNPPAEQVGNHKFMATRERYWHLFRRDTIDETLEEWIKDPDRALSFFKDRDTFHFWGVSSFFCSSKRDMSEGELDLIENDSLSFDKVHVSSPTYVLQFERLQEDFDLLAGVVGFERGILPRVNVPAHKRAAGSLPRVSISEGAKYALQQTFGFDYDLLNRIIKTKHVSLSITGVFNER